MSLTLGPESPHSNTLCHYRRKGDLQATNRLEMDLHGNLPFNEKSASKIQCGGVGASI